MFNVSKKTLSVVLCLALLASVVAACFMTPASAETITSTQAIYNDLSKELTPVVDLTFDGDKPYGIPFGRFTSGKIVYENNYVKFVSANGSKAFIGVSGEVGQTVVHNTNDTITTQKTAAVANLYHFKADETYRVNFDVKILGGTSLSDRIVNYGTVENPIASGANVTLTDVSESGLTLAYNNDGEYDWQEVSITFTTPAAGYFGISCINGFDIAIDNVKVYDLSAYYDSNFQNKLTFDSESGIVIGRGVTVPTYDKEDGNMYAMVKPGETRRPFFFAKSEPSDAVLNANNVDASTEEGLAKINAAYDKMFKFLPGKTYEVSFKYRYDKAYLDRTWYNNLPLELIVTADPACFTVGQDILDDSNSWAKDITVEGNETITKIGFGAWQELKVTFTVKTAEEVGEAVLATLRDGYTFSGAYFSFTAHARDISVDDYQVKEVVKEISITTDYVSHDMEDVDVDAQPSNLTMNGTGTATVVAEEGRGNVLQMTDRGAFNDTNVFVAGKKYYISFDGKSTNGSAQDMSLWLAKLGSSASKNSKCRYPINANSPFEYYVDGVETTDYANFKLGATWQRFGIIIDLTNSTVLDHIVANSGADGGATFLDTDKYFYVGNSNSTIDNFKIVSFTSDVDSKLSDVKSNDFTYVSKTYFNDFNDMSSVTLHKSATAEVSNNQVNVTSGRFTVANSNIITAGHKYTISFKAKLNESAGDSSPLWLSLGAQSSTNSKTRFIISNADGSVGETGKNKDAFAYYINDDKLDGLADFKINKEWKDYAITFDFANEAYLNDFSNIASQNNYFFLGCANGEFDDLKIVEWSPEGTYAEVSYRQPSGAGENYISAGLRFKATVPNALIESDSTAEIGFVVAPSSNASVTPEWYKLENGLNKIARKAVVYLKDSKYNWAYSTTVDSTDYQLVITDLSAEVNGNPEGMKAYNRRFSVVVYAKDKQGNYSYSAVGEASYYQTLGITEALRAKKIKEAEQ